MKTETAPPDYKGFRFPPEIISAAEHRATMQDRFQVWNKITEAKPAA